MKIEYIKVDGIEREIDFDAHYMIAGWRGIAFVLLGWHAEYRPVMCDAEDQDGREYEIESGEFELEPDFDRVVAVMVGDDRRHMVDLSDLTVIAEDSFCRSCGQIGCRCNVYA